MVLKIGELTTPDSARLMPRRRLKNWRSSAPCRQGSVRRLTTDMRRTEADRSVVWLRRTSSPLPTGGVTSSRAQNVCIHAVGPGSDCSISIWPATDRKEVLPTRARGCVVGVLCITGVSPMTMVSTAMLETCSGQRRTHLVLTSGLPHGRRGLWNSERHRWHARCCG